MLTRHFVHPCAGTDAVRRSAGPNPKSMVNATKVLVEARNRPRAASRVLLAVAALVATGLIGCRVPTEAPSRGAGARTKTQGKVLIVTGEDYPGHKWQRTEAVLRRQLIADSRLTVDVVRDLTQLASADLRAYDAVVLHFKNYDPAVPGRDGYDNLTRFVRAGGGLVLVHFACGAFQEYKQEFETLAGRVWNPKFRGHDRYGRFRVEILETDHAVTRGMTSFETTDELYTCLEGTTPVTVLADARSNVDGKRHPMAFVLRYGAGRVFHSPLGHDVRALAVPAVGALFRRGCAWAAGLDPAAQPGSTIRKTIDPTAGKDRIR